jgi:hypothetical protein
VTRLGAFGKSTRAFKNMLYTSAPLAAELERSHRLRAEVCDAIIDEGDAPLALAAAVHISAGRVKLGTAALARAETHPLAILDGGSSDESAASHSGSRRHRSRARHKPLVEKERCMSRISFEIKDRESWLVMRGRDLTASRIAALFDQHPFLSRPQLATQLRGGARRFDSFHMRAGRMDHLACGVARETADISSVRLKLE